MKYFEVRLRYSGRIGKIRYLCATILLPNPIFTTYRRFFSIFFLNFEPCALYVSNFCRII